MTTNDARIGLAQTYSSQQNRPFAISPSRFLIKGHGGAH